MERARVRGAHVRLQDRVDEAAALFARVDAAPPSLHLQVRRSRSYAAQHAAHVDSFPNAVPNTPCVTYAQYDYMRAYFDFCAGRDLERAGAIAAKYAAYPVASKRKLFTDIADQLREIER